MGVITISRQYGSGGLTLGREVAEALGYRYADKELVAEVAREANMPTYVVERFDECPESVTSRVLRQFLTPYPAQFSGEVYEELFRPGDISRQSVLDYDEPFLLADEGSLVRLTQKVMTRLANQGNVVLIGRGGQVLLSERSDVLHVRVISPIEDRVKFVMEEERVPKEEAELLIRKIDRNRERYLKRNYGIDWENPNHYHLTINTGLMDMARAIQIIISVA